MNRLSTLFLAAILYFAHGANAKVQIGKYEAMMLLCVIRAVHK